MNYPNIRNPSIGDILLALELDNVLVYPVGIESFLLQYYEMQPTLPQVMEYIKEREYDPDPL